MKKKMKDSSSIDKVLQALLNHLKGFGNFLQLFFVLVKVSNLYHIILSETHRFTGPYH